MKPGPEMLCCRSVLGYLKKKSFPPLISCLAVVAGSKAVSSLDGVTNFPAYGDLLHALQTWRPHRHRTVKTAATGCRASKITAAKQGVMSCHVSSNGAERRSIQHLDQNPPPLPPPPVPAPARPYKTSLLHPPRRRGEANSPAKHQHATSIDQ